MNRSLGIRSSFAFGLFAALIAFILPSGAQAYVSGDPPSLEVQYRLYGDAVVTGNTLMFDTCPYVNTVLLSESSGDISGVPSDAVLEGAYLYWAASRFAPDTTATLRLPDGSQQSVSSTGACHSVSHLGGSYGCMSDVTAFVASHPGSNSYNGVYSVGDVAGDTGLVDSACICLDANCQGKFAGWSLVMVYSSPSETTQRDIYLYDGFRVIDEELTTPGTDSFTISGFNVGSPPEAELAFFALEGDRQLGIPEQGWIPEEAGGCPDGSCVDSLELNGVPLSNSFNPAGNVYNGTVPGGYAVGVDLDQYDVSSLVASGDQQAMVRLVSGDGVFNNDPNAWHGYGEFVIVNWLLLRLNRLAPNFGGSKTRLDVAPTEVAPGGTVYFTLTVTNEGSMEATNVVVTDVLPPGLSYVAGTTQVDGVTMAGTPLATGLNLGTISHTGDNDVRITFQATVSDSALPGRVFQSSATISADQLATPVETNSVTVRVIGAQLGRASKVDKDINGGDPTPEDIIEYEIYISKEDETSVGGLEFVDTISPYVQLIEVTPGPYDTSNSEFNGGANGTGYVDIRGISIPAAQDGIYLRYKVQILSIPELLAKGVAPDEINGLIVENQGTISASFLSTPLRTDDPSRPGFLDSTRFTLVTGLDFMGSDTLKTAVDHDGGELLPGDQVDFTITLSNRGSEAGTVSLVDDIPPFITGAVLSSGPAGSSLTPAPAGLYGQGQLVLPATTVGPGESVELQFFGFVDPATPDGTLITNSAELNVVEDPSQSRALVSAPLVVFNRPVLTTTKTVVNLTSPGGFQPSDEVRYTISIANDGTIAATDVIVIDAVDVVFEDVIAEDGGVYDLASGAITWDAGDIPAGGSLSLSFTGRIRASVSNGTGVANQAVIQGSNFVAQVSDDPATAAADDPTVFVVEAMPELDTFTKSYVDENGGAVEPGDSILYTLRVTNTGRAVSTLTTVRDVMDAAFVSVSPLNGGVYDVATRTVTWDLGTLAVGDSRDLQVRAVLADVLPNGSVVANQAVVSSTEIGGVQSDDPATAAVDDATLFTIASAAQLTTSTKEVEDLNGGLFQPGDAIRYTLTLVNEGNAPASDVVVTDLIDPLLVDLIAEEGGVYDGTQVVWSLAGAVQPGTPVTLHLAARVAESAPAGAVIANQASIVGTDISTPVLTDDPSTPAAADPTVFEVFRLPEFVTSTKRVEELSGDGVFNPGEGIRYTIAVINSGADEATSVVVSDTIDSNLTPLSASLGGVISGNTVTWNIPSIPAGETIELTVNAELDSPLANGLEVSNQAAIVCAEQPTPALTDDPSTAAVDDPTLFEVESKPDFSTATKDWLDINGGEVEAGDRIAYTIELTNTGMDTADQVVIRDQVDLNLQDITVSGGGVYDATTRTILWESATNSSLTALAPGEGVVMSFEAQVVDPIANMTEIVNQAQISSSDSEEIFLTDDPNTADVDDPTRFVVISAADLTGAVKTVSPAGPQGYRPGDVIEYTISFTNEGTDSARALEVVDDMDGALTNFVALDGGVVTNDTIRWLVGEVGVGESVVLRVQAEIRSPLDDGTEIFNQARLTSPEFGSDVLTDNPATPEVDDPTRVEVTSAPSFASSTKAVVDLDGDGFWEPGDRIQYQIEVQNTGDAGASGISVVDPIDTNALTDILPLDGGVLSGDTITWTIATLPAGSSALLRFEAEIGALSNGDLVANQATVSDANGRTEVTDDPTTSVSNDATVFTVTAGPRLVATKSFNDLNGGDLLGGDPIRYSIVVSNEGTEQADDVLIIDTAPAELIDVAGFGIGLESVVDSTVTWRMRGLAAGEQVSLAIEATVRPGTPDGQIISNQAQISATGGLSMVSDDPSTPELNDATIAVVNAEADFSDSLMNGVDANGGSYLKPGEEIVYTINVRNGGYGDAQRVVVQVELPAGVVNWTASDNGVISGGAVQWTADTTPSFTALPAGMGIDLELRGLVDESVQSGTSIRAQGFISADEIEATPTDDPATPDVDDATILVVNYPSLRAFTKTVEDLNGGSVNPGDQLRYTLTLQNQEGMELVNGEVRDQLSEALVFESASQGGLLNSQGEVVWNASSTPALGALSAGASLSLELVVSVAEGTPDGSLIRNQASFSALELEQQLSDDPSLPGANDPTIVEVSVVTGPDLSGATKRVVDLNGGEVLPGDVLEYRMSFPNTGTTASASTLVFDAIPDWTRYVGASTLVNGFPVSDNSAGLSPLVDGLQVSDLTSSAPGVIAMGQAAEVSFQVEINSDTPLNTWIENQGTISASGGILEPTDDPNTSAVDDRTRILVGASASLATPLKSATYDDANGNGQLDINEAVLYTITLEAVGNGAVEDINVTDPLPEGADYRAASLSLDDELLTDAIDSDSGSVEAGQISVYVDRLEPGRQRIIRYTMFAREEGQLINQATVRADEAALLTDDPTRPGDADATIVVVGESSGQFLVTKDSPVDVNGEDALAGDLLRYTIRVENISDSSIMGLRFVDEFPVGLVDVALESVPADASLLSDGQQVTGSLGTIATGEAVQVQVSARIAKTSPMGSPFAMLPLQREQSRLFLQMNWVLALHPLWCPMALPRSPGLLLMTSMMTVPCKTMSLA